MKNPVEWTLSKHKEFWGQEGRAYSVCEKRDENGVFVILLIRCPVEKLLVSSSNFLIPSCSVRGPALITSPPAQLCACDFPQYSKAERHPVTALEKMMESSFAGPQSFPEVPSPNRGSQSVKHHRYRELIMVGMGALTQCVTLDNTCRGMTTLFRRDDRSCFSCSSPCSGCSSSSWQAKQRYQAAVPLEEA